MRNGFLGSLTVLTVSATLALAQTAPREPASYPLWPGNTAQPSAAAPTSSPAASGIQQTGLFSRASRDAGKLTSIETMAPPEVGTVSGPTALPVSGGPVPLEGSPVPSGLPYTGDPWAGMTEPMPAAPVASNSCEHVYGSAEFLLWAPRRQPLIGPAVSSGAPTLPFSNTQPFLLPSTTANVNFLTNPSVAGVIGTGPINISPQPGFRVTLGKWCDEDRRLGYNLSGFALEERTDLETISSDPQGIPVLFRPFQNAFTGQPSALLIAYPGLAAGRAEVAADTFAWSAEANAVMNLYRNNCPGKIHNFVTDSLSRWNVFAGPRYFELDERLAISSNSVILSDRVVPVGNLSFTGPFRLRVSDTFDTRNSFYGGQIGSEMEFRAGHWTLNLMGKVGVGYMYESVRILGTTEVDRTVGPNANPNLGGAPGIFRGGLFAQPSNIGKHDNDEFAVIPEGNVKVGYVICKGVQAFVGYTFLYVDKVARPGSQIDTVVNPNQVPLSTTFGAQGGLTAPRLLLRQDTYWLQGADFGLSFAF